MVLPLYLAMTASEFRPGPHAAFLMMAPSDTPPPGALAVVTDRFPTDGQALHVLCQHRDAVLLDFAHPPTRDVREIIRRLPCPAAAPPGYADTGPVFLPPAPLHVPPEEHLRPWRGREIWLEAALQKQTVTVTAEGVAVSPPCTNSDITDGYFSDILCCRFTQKISEDMVVFTLFDTLETLRIKLDRFAALGVTRAVGLWQELGEKHMSTY